MGLQKIIPATLYAAAAGIVLLAGAGANAGSSSATRHQAQSVGQIDPRPGLVRMPDGRICERICPQDNLPCDPINFKIADGRCRGVMSTPR